MRYETRRSIPTLARWATLLKRAARWPAVLLCPFVPRPIIGQDVTPIVLSEPTCESCRVTAELLTSLGDRDGPGSLTGPWFTMTRSVTSGRYFLSQFPPGSEVLVFSSTGRFERTLGRRGQGPGEFSLIRLLDASRDQLAVADVRLRRVTILDKQGDVGATFPLQGDVQSWIVRPDRLIYSSFIPTPELIGFPIHVADSSGDIQVSFGHDGEPLVAPSGFTATRLLADSGDSGIWASRRTRYAITKYSVEGVPLAHIERRAAWFQPYQGDPRLPDPDVPPQPFVTDLHVDDSGLLWILIAVSDPEWRRGLVPSEIPEGRGYQVEDFNRYYDTIVEVIDPSAGMLISSERFDQYVSAFIEGTQGAVYSEGADLFPRIDILRFGLQR